MQANKMRKRSITIFFNNLNFISMQKHLNYKNINKIRVLLTKLPYSKVTWWIKNLSPHSVTIDIALKEYLICYLDSISIIQFLISY